MGECGRATGRWKYLTDMDYIVEIWKQAWDALSETQKEALVYHELRHVKKTIKETDDDVVIRWGLRKHTHELFVDEISHFGTWNRGLLELQSMFKTIEE
jgi:hypothetical protein